MTNDRDLERALVDAGRSLDLPDVPDLATAVRAEIERGRSPGLRPQRRLALAAAALVVVASAGVAASPAARTAIADLLGVLGIDIRVGDAPAPDGLPADPVIAPGRATTLEAAEAEVPFDVAVPTALGPPDRVHLTDDGRVTLSYDPRPGLPEARQTGLGALVTQFRATIDDRVLIKKVAAAGTAVRPISVGGARGYWLTGAPHVVYYLDGESVVEDTLRLAANTLVWDDASVTYRIETALPLRSALGIARTMR